MDSTITKISQIKWIRTVIRFLGLSNIVRRWYFNTFKPKDGILSVSTAGDSAQFYIKAPGELRVLESMSSGKGEQLALEALLEKLSQGNVVYDIGGHVGLYSIFFAKKVGELGKVFTFEPEAQNYRHLQENISLNHLQNVKVFNVALSDTSGTQKLFLGEEMSNSSLSDILKPGDKFETVKVAAGDELVEKENLPVPYLVKIDVEGHEYQVIKGLKKSLASEKCKVLFCEIHTILLPKDITKEMILDFVRSLGFTHIELEKRDTEYHLIASK